MGTALGQQDLLLRVLLSEGTSANVQLGPHEQVGALERRPAGAGNLRVWAGAGGVLVEGREVGPWVEFAAPDGFTLGGRAYRGNLLVVWQSKQLLFINRVWLEDYLLGVVPAEVPASFPEAVLQAQAILARTFALYRLNPGGVYDLCATERCQVYLGRNAETPRHTLAVQATRGLIVAHNQRPITAVYHADSGGYTAAAEEVWGRSVPYLIARPDPYAQGASRLWSRTLSPDGVAQGLLGMGLEVGSVQYIGPTLMSESGRPLRLRVVGSARSVELDAPQSTRLLRGLGLPSTRVRFEGWQVYGQGSGHGVGLSQWGARGLALLGWDFRQILGYYYPGTFLSGFEVVQEAQKRLLGNMGREVHPAARRTPLGQAQILD
ncbi:MAG: SpoIID/LytB domain-containing protein [Meiothermus sp.]|uniref:SpoIID/LytB domain-containing protein n=1 Tax=Meiothermus sp. TaxID=1955249 RepID=UPI0025E89774|nr:SpoIID/LytB domain-containing protein [Meiothermus sp.]MCS7059220.1 SpoIID/LytB domain-containing protein [Meiothermus sp.]MDW8091559.1 SpoIID/LytB domain-containing protein [Meiothermus sp.]MDW8482623.1 SpoIID/LytB domain-containing protein [Meiothermus sp.]